MQKTPYRSLVVLIMLQILMVLGQATASPVDHDMLLLSLTAFGIYWAGWFLLVITQCSAVTKSRFAMMGVPLCVVLVVAVFMATWVLMAPRG